MKTIILLFTLIVAVLSFNSIKKFEMAHKNGCVGVKTFWERGTTTSLLCCREPFPDTTQIVGFSTSPNIDSQRKFVLQFNDLTKNKSIRTCRYKFEKTGLGND